MSRMQRLEHSDKPEKEAPAGNLSAPGKPVFLPQESCEGQGSGFGQRCCSCWSVGKGRVLKAAGRVNRLGRPTEE